MAELFATADDAYIVLGLTEEESDNRDTADGRPRTRVCAAARLARMIGEDAPVIGASAVTKLAEQIVSAQAQLVAQAIDRQRSALSQEGRPLLLFTGHGWPLFQEVLKQVAVASNYFALTSIVPAEASRCAPAAAVAWLYSNASQAGTV
jgi:uncharacterized hydantoinase/oxoprolinase family protein